MSRRQKDSFRIAAARVTVITVGLSSLIALLWFGLLARQNSERRQLEGEIAEMQNDLARKGLLLGPDILRRELDKEIAYNNELLNEWTNTVERLDVFHGFNHVSAEKTGKIDYKVALFDVKQRLLKKAQALQIQLPHKIGMEAVVKSNEDARRLIHQLKAVETLLDAALDININTVKFVEPIPPRGYHPRNSSEIFVEEYPVQIQLYGNVESLYHLLSPSRNGRPFFVLRHLKVRSVSESKPDLLDICAVMSSLLFLKSPETIDTMQNTMTPVIKITPRGH